MDSLISSAEAIGLLQMLVTLYQVTRRDALAETIKGLIRELRGEPTVERSREYIIRQVTERAGAAEAQEVERDFDLVEMLVTPPNVARFDYWTMLLRVATSFRDVARRTGLLKLRGALGEDGLFVVLPSVAEKLVPNVDVRSAFERRTTTPTIQVIGYAALLYDVPNDNPNSFPIRIAVQLLETYYHGLPGDETLTRRTTELFVVKGREPNRVLLTEISSYNPRQIAVLLTADAVLQIIQAIENDVGKLAAEIRDEQRRLESDLEPKVAALLQRLAVGAADAAEDTTEHKPGR